MQTLLKTIATIAILFGFEEISAKSSCKENSCHASPTLQNSNKYKKYIENTIWVVPPDSLLAFEYNEGSHTAASDQTVWVIDNFRQGYFFGHSYESINQSELSQMSMLGSVTDQGDVYITFYPVDGEQSSQIVSGIGKFIKKDGQYVFVMQMNSSPDDTIGLSHWAYMVSVNKHSCFYQNLPGENMSVPEFLSQF